MFTLDRPASDQLAWQDGAPIALELEDHSRKQVMIGHLVSISGKEVQIAWESKGFREDSELSSQQPPRSGVITLYQQEEWAVFERQRAALSLFMAGDTANPRLADVLQDLSKAEFAPVDDRLQFYQQDLADDKKNAVRQALATQDVFLLQGPPGTGKTTTLAEIILQILKVTPDARILVSSQSNVAVNHVISRVAELREGQRTEIVRIGRAEKIQQGAEEWTLEHRIENWRTEVLARTEPIVKELKERVRQQQKQKQQDSTVDNDRDLQDCGIMLDEMQGDLDELAEYEAQYAIRWEEWSKSVSADDQLPRVLEPELLQLMELIDTKKEHIASTLALVVAYLPQTAVGAPASTLDAEHQRLRSIVKRMQDGEDVVSQDAKILDLVQRWRKVFGKRDDFAVPILDRANILAATCLITGGRDLKGQRFDWAIIDEAGRATAPELLVPLVRSRRAIIVGDERQLPPMLDENLPREELARQGVERADLEESLVETLVKEAREARLEAAQMLTVQHRMHPAIGRLVSDVFYDGKLEHGVLATERTHGLPWLPRAVVWYSTTRAPDHYETRREHSFYNRVEVHAVVQLLQRMEETYQSQGETRRVAVITPYNAQIAELQEHVIPQSVLWRALRIEIATIDAFQGRDCDVVIYSTVRSNGEAKLGFLRDRRRLNVALSRARQLLVIVGDLATLENGRLGADGNPYLELARYLRDHPEDCLIEDVEGTIHHE